MKWRDAALDVFFPCRRCLVCDGAEAVEEGICAVCREKLRRLPEPVCAVCGKPLAGRAVCLACTMERPPYSAARCAFLYEDAARDLVRRMKFSGEFDLPARLFGREIARMVGLAGWRPEVVTCVPATARTRRERGYNQAEVLGRRVSRLLRLPFLPRALGKRSGTRSQVGLSAEERRANIAGSILPNRDAARFVGKTVLLVDDVMTTGATVEECASTLLQHGAEAVYVACAVRRLYTAEDDLKREE